MGHFAPQRGFHPQAPDTFEFNPHSQLIIGYRCLAFLNQVLKQFSILFSLISFFLILGGPREGLLGITQFSYKKIRTNITIHFKRFYEKTLFFRKKSLETSLLTFFFKQNTKVINNFFCD